MKKVWVIKLLNGSYYIGVFRNCGYESSWSLTRRVQTYATKTACEKAIKELHDRFKSLEGYPVQVWGY